MDIVANLNNMKMSIEDLKGMMSDVSIERQEEFQDIILALQGEIKIISDSMEFSKK